MVLLANISIAYVILILMTLVGMTLSLKCYTCHTNDNSLCTDEFLLDCPSNQAYDRCMTRIFKKPKDGLHIKKECALAPCHIRDPKLAFITLNDQCKNNDDECIFCCPTDGCNKDASHPLNAHKLSSLFYTEVSGLECYVCKNQENNKDKCVETVKTCDLSEDRCLSEVRWGSTPYWAPTGEKQFYVSKRCSSKRICEQSLRNTSKRCDRIWYNDWECVECCNGDRCNYYITVSSAINYTHYSSNNI
ncbi:unnamed protein product [Medioppia subpectinata]|uniref:Uncharacterized protein n=1 Tax=Medioppia subpectinata TaxID=1979941 RepID=A0A7R9KKJ0_9ACAR|nr:unnamed protein product [Medioppia subpectinata]CAG2103945.1 unnamed protein product [Medioppia subpectinata]